MNRPQPSIRGPHDRRGNAMVLTAGILVLLVIIATAYITRTQGGRYTATAVQQANTRDTGARDVAALLADHVAEALFPRPVDPTFGATADWTFGAWLPADGTQRYLASADMPRLDPSFGSGLRYGIDRDVLDNVTVGTAMPLGPSDGLPDFPYNVAPHIVVPSTNWPDAPAYPRGPSNPIGATIDPVNGLSLDEANPVGNPSFGDSRWLRDTEPLRWNVNATFGNTGADDVLFDDDAFKYWRKLSYIATANNGVRLVRDLSDVLDSDNDGVGGLLLDLDVPVEQWLTSVQPFDSSLQLFSGITGDARMTSDASTIGGADLDEFVARWQRWFTPEFLEPADPMYPSNSHAFAYNREEFIPPNLYKLTDLDADNFYLEPGERPQDAFVRGTARWNVERVLADADGDGFTDSFWFLLPTPVERGIRTVVAVSVVDNSALLDINTAGVFRPWDAGNSGLERTMGETPADVALVGAGARSDWFTPQALVDFENRKDWNVGFLDNYLNWEMYADYPGRLTGGQLLYGGSDVRWTPNRWPEMMVELGLRDPDDALPAAGNEPWLRRAIDRRFYFQTAGARPFEASFGFTPFSLADELELRMYHGSNYPWSFSRLERAINTTGGDFGFLRSGLGFEESNPYLDQLANPELLHDNRRKLTAFSGARNDLMPPWLWWWVDDLPQQVLNNLAGSDQNGNGLDDAIDNFYAQSRVKVDLREAAPDTVIGNIAPGQLYLRDRLLWTTFLALTDSTSLVDGSGRSYFGTFDLDEVRKAAAAFTANVLAYRDRDEDAELEDEIATTPREVLGPVFLPDTAGMQPGGSLAGATPARSVGYLGMEKQPFLLEAFVGHVYKVFTIPGNRETGPGWTNSGDRILTKKDEAGNKLYTTVSVVQIANPYDTPIRLFDPSDPDNNANVPEYELTFFGQTVSLWDVAKDLGIEFLPAALDELPATMILYTIEEDAFGEIDFDERWEDFLDVQAPDHPAGTIIANLGGGGFTVSPFSTQREYYDVAPVPSDGAARISRVYFDAGGVPLAKVLIDRMDRPEANGRAFLNSVRFLAADQPPDPGVVFPPTAPPQDPYPTVSEWEVDTEDVAASFSESHWVQWVRATRAWGNDWGDGLPDANGLYGFPDFVSNPTERNPRFIASAPAGRFDQGELTNIRTQVTASQPIASGHPAAGVSDWFEPAIFRNGQPCQISLDPDGDPSAVPPVLPWMSVRYALPSDPTVVTGPQTATVWEQVASGALVLDSGTAPTLTGRHKPTFLDMRHIADPGVNVWLYPDKGFYHSRFSNQMLQKDGDVQQVGELLNVWLFGHELEFTENPGGPNLPPVYSATERTFSEHFRPEDEPEDPAQRGRVNRLNFDEIVGATTNPFGPDLGQAFPDLPAGIRLLDAFVCDGPGRRFDPTSSPPDQFLDFAFGNALGFSGRATPGLVNLNTAPIEVLRALPGWSKLVHADPDALTAGAATASLYPRSALPETVVAYRERFGRNNNIDPMDPLNVYGLEFGVVGGPDYSDRTQINDEIELRNERGIASIGEIRLMEEEPAPDNPSNVSFNAGSGNIYEELLDLDRRVYRNAWKASFAASNPFNLQDTSLTVPQWGAWLGTDVVGLNYDYDPSLANWSGNSGDLVAGDAEEANLLFSGASNLVTTRSDVFTVYFRVRSFREDPNGSLPSGYTGPVWDATNPEYIVDDSRYVMLVDRSRVNAPTDEPRILYLEKLPN